MDFSIVHTIIDIIIVYIFNDNCYYIYPVLTASFLLYFYLLKRFSLIGSSLYLYFFALKLINISILTTISLYLSILHISYNFPYMVPCNIYYMGICIAVLLSSGLYTTRYLLRPNININKKSIIGQIVYLLSNIVRDPYLLLLIGTILLVSIYIRSFFYSFLPYSLCLAYMFSFFFIVYCLWLPTKFISHLLTSTYYGKNFLDFSEFKALI